VKWYFACTEVVLQKTHIPKLISYVSKSSCTETVHPFVPKLSCTESDLTPLKTILRSLLDRFPDTALLWAFHAYREVPVDTLGCGLFELLFGRTVPGPLQLVKSVWLQGMDLSTAKQSVVEFILNTCERLCHALDLASTQAAQERSKTKVWYNHHARLCTFQPVDKVLLVLMPMTENRLILSIS